MPPPTFAASEIESLQSAFRDALQDMSARLSELGGRLLDRLVPEQWVMEWHLPWWLGQAFELDPAPIRTLVLSNLFGLGYVRLRDDLVDGRVAPPDRAEVLCLSDLLYRRALHGYAGLFAADSPFWRYLDRYMAEWLAATLASNWAPDAPLDLQDAAQVLALAGRGAPLKIGVAATCLLAERPAEIEPIAAVVDRALAATVLLDHAADWEEDLAEGRYNLFAAAATAIAQTAENRDAVRRGVLTMLMLGDGGHGYLAVVDACLADAQQLAAGLGYSALEAQMEAFRDLAAQYGVDLQARAAEHLRWATEQVFGPAATS